MITEISEVENKIPGTSDLVTTTVLNTKLSENENEIPDKVFKVYIKHYWHFEGVTPKQCCTLLQTSSNTEIFRGLLSNNATYFFRAYIKQYWHFRRVTGKQYYTLTFPELTLNKTDIFRELLSINTTHFSGGSTKQY